MSVSRRELLGGAALLGAAGAFGLHRMAGQAGAPAPGTVIFDSGRPASLAYAQARGGGAAPIDLVQERATNWRAIRALGKEPVAGVTGWTDYVAARGWLEQRGLRVMAQEHDRRSDLIHWTMA